MIDLVRLDKELMTVTLDLPPEVEATFAAQARARGVPIDTFLLEYLIQHAPPMQPEKLSPGQWDQAFDELFGNIGDELSCKKHSVRGESVVYHVCGV